jgi:hypothetical protein
MTRRGRLLFREAPRTSSDHEQRGRFASFGKGFGERSPAWGDLADNQARRAACTIWTIGSYYSLSPLPQRRRPSLTITWYSDRLSAVGGWCRRTVVLINGQDYLRQMSSTQAFRHPVFFYGLHYVCQVSERAGRPEFSLGFLLRVGTPACRLHLVDSLLKVFSSYADIDLSCLNALMPRELLYYPQGHSSFLEPLAEIVPQVMR